MLGENTQEHSNLFWLKALLISLLAYLEIPWEITLLMSGCIIVDTFFGVIKSARLGARIEFKLLIWGLITKISVLFIPFFIALIGKVLGYDMKYFVNFFIYLIIGNDSVSIITNILSIKTGRSYKNDDFIEMGINSVRVLIKSGLMKAIERVKNGDDCEVDKDRDERT